MKYQAYPEYKYSGVEWHENIPIDWGIRRLKYFSESVSTGTTPPSSNPEYYESPNTSWYTPVDFVDGSIALGDSKRKINSSSVEDGVVKVFKSGSILVVGIGATLGKVALSKIVFTCNQQINVITPDKYMSPRFIAYSLSVKIDVMKMISNASTLGILNQEKTKQVHLCAPSKDNQEKIADFLDYKTQQIDQLIEKKKALIEKLNEQRIAVITQAVTKGLDKTAKMKPSGVHWLGDVPEHWGVRPLKFVASYNDESLPDTTDSEKDIQYVEISSINYVDGISEIELTTFGKAPSRARRIVKHGDTIISTVRTYLKAISTVINPPENMIVSTGFAVIRPTELIDSEFLSFFLLSQKFIDTIVANSKGVSYPAINASELVTLHIAFPEDRAEQRNITDYILKHVNHVDDMVNANRKTIEYLEEYRTALIIAAVTGKIDVRGFEIPSQETT